MMDSNALNNNNNNNSFSSVNPPETDATIDVPMIIDVDDDVKDDHYMSPRKRILAFLTLLIILLSILFLTFYIYAYYRIRDTMTAPGAAMPTYIISQFKNDSFTVQIRRNVTYNAPVPFDILPFKLTYGTPDSDFGYFEFPEVHIVPGVPVYTDFTQNFVITDAKVLQDFGHSILDTFANHESRDFQLVTHGSVGVRSLTCLYWNIAYTYTYNFHIGPINITKASTNNNNNNSSKVSNSPLTGMSWSLKPFGFELVAEYTNPLPISIGFGDITANVSFDNQHLSLAIVPNYTLLLQNNTAVIDFTAVNFWKLLEFAIGFGPSKFSTLSIQNVTVNSNGTFVSWLNGWFDDLVFSLPPSDGVEPQKQLETMMMMQNVTSTNVTKIQV